VVTYLPSRPAKGELLIVKTISSVGSSTVSAAAARGLAVADRVADLDVLQADEGHDVAGGRLLDLDAAQLVEDVDLRHLATPSLAVSAFIRAISAPADRAPRDAADGDPAHVLGPVERGDQHLQRRVRIDLRARDRSSTMSSSGCIESPRGLGSCVA
jgi:hypothetical protein